MLKTISRKFIAAVAAFGIVAGFSAPASAVLFTFSDLSGDGPGVAVANQITVDVTDAGGGKVTFTFANSGPLASNIKMINFDDSAADVLGTFVNFTASTGVDFSVNLKNLPQGNSVGFVSTDGFQATPPPGGANGNSINPGESLGITFNLNVAFATVLLALGNGDLRIGMHVISLVEAPGSDVLLNDVVPEIPLPAALPLLLSGLAGLGFVSRRRKTA